jgi:hypothetical protein
MVAQDYGMHVHGDDIDMYPEEYMEQHLVLMHYVHHTNFNSYVETLNGTYIMRQILGVFLWLHRPC